MDIVYYLKYHLTSNWKNVIEELKKETVRGNEDYKMIHIKCNVEKIDLFKNAIPPPKYITICLICVKQYAENIYWCFSDSERGVYDRVACINGYYIACEQNLLLGENHLEDKICRIGKHPIYVILDFLTGEKDIKHCCNNINCNNTGSLLICSRCKLAKYCSQICQKQHWHIHRKTCK